MPTYQFNCPACGSTTQEVRRISGRDDPLSCSCGHQMSRQQVYALRLSGVEFKPYRSPASGRLIDSPTKERDELARTDCFIDEPGVPQQIARRRKEIEAAGDAQLGGLVEKLYGELEASGKAL